MLTGHTEPEARGLRVAARVLVDVGLEANETLEIGHENDIASLGHLSASQSADGGAQRSRSVDAENARESVTSAQQSGSVGYVDAPEPREWNVRVPKGRMVGADRGRS